MSDPSAVDRAAKRMRETPLDRGYPNGRLDRFVLSDSRGDRGLAVHPWRPLLRASVIAGPALAALLTTAVAAFSALPLRVWDTLGLFALLGLLSTGALFLVYLGGASVASWTAFRRRMCRAAPILAQLCAGLPIALYLGALWWMRGNEPPGLMDVFFLGLAVLLTLLVARIAEAVASAALIRRGEGIPVPRRRTALVLAAGFLLVSALLLAARTAGHGGGTSAWVPAFGVREGASRLLLIGVDGLDTGVVQAFEPRGSVSQLLDGMRRGSTYPLHRSEGAGEVWNTILTGLPDGLDGVAVIPASSSAGSPRRGGRAGSIRNALRFLLPFSSARVPAARRQVRTLWEIVALRKPAAAVGWPGSWPAAPFDGEDVEGYLVSDRTLPRLLAGAEGDRDTWPASLFSILAVSFEEDRAVLREEFEALVSIAEGGEIREWLWESILIDGYSWRVARRLIRDESLAAVFVHLPGLDLLRGRLARLEAERELHTLLEIREALECYVRWLDSLLGDALSPPPGWDVLLIGEPGRQGSGQTEGFAALAGRDARSGCVGAPLSTLDVAPLALGLLGFPRSLEMEGERPEYCLLEEIDLQEPVAGYGRGSARRVADLPPDEGLTEERARERRNLE